MNIFNSIMIWNRWLISRLDQKRCVCPSCGGKPAEIIDRRFLVLTLARCKNCGLLYRQPTDEINLTKKFYQGEYQDPSITDIPSEKELEELISHGFTKKFNRSAQVDLVKHILGTGNFKILDYGCSWGYASWQFINAGFKVEAFEIGRERAEFAANWLKIPVYTEENKLKGKFDLVYSGHVFEHIPHLASILDRLKELIVPGGYLLAITPNGGNDARNHHPELWHKLWGKRHPIFLDANYWFKSFESWPKIAFTRKPFSGNTHTPLDELTRDAIARSTLLDLSGDELVFIAQKPMR